MGTPDRGARSSVVPVAGRRRFLFVVGVPRTGTTALALVLNRHSRILIGMERYKNLCSKARIDRCFAANLFLRDRFFDVRDGDTNLRQDWLLGQQSSFEEKSWIGDKVPNLYKRLDVVLARFPGAAIFCMLRDAHDVAASWQFRALRESDSWPAGNDYFKAIDTWNRANRKLLRYKSLFGDQVQFLNYSGLFGSGTDRLDRVLASLALDREKAIGEFYAAMRQKHSDFSARKARFDELREKSDHLIESGPYEELRALGIV